MMNVSYIRNCFCPNLHFMYPEYSFIDRFSAAANDGFSNIEFCFAYDRGLDAISKALEDNKLSLISFNFPSGELFPGKIRGLAGLPGSEHLFDEQIAQGLQWAKALDCGQAIAPLACIVPDSLDAERCLESYIKNISRAARSAELENVTLLIEPNNNIEHPGYLLNFIDQCRYVVEKVNSPNVGLLFDTYHTQIMEGDLTTNFVRHHQYIRHIQIGNVPGRHDTNCGEINHDYLFKKFEDYNYLGWIAGEYYPVGDTSAGLDWLVNSDENSQK